MGRRLTCSSATFHKRRADCGGTDALPMTRLKELKHKKHRLKKIYAE